MRYLGIDYGEKKVGVAVSDEAGMMAFPRRVIKNNASLVPTLMETVVVVGASAIVIGESSKHSGEHNELMTQIQEFAETLRRTMNLPIYFEKEWMSSVEARRFQGSSKDVDDSAAAIMLQRFLDKQGQILHTERVEQISYDDFRRVDIRVGTILSAEKIEKADKLFKLMVDLGDAEPRQIVSGIAPYFADPQSLVGKQACFVANLEPRDIRGYISNGMILAVGGGEEDFSLIGPLTKNRAGSRVK